MEYLSVYSDSDQCKSVGPKILLVEGGWSKSKENSPTIEVVCMPFDAVLKTTLVE